MTKSESKTTNSILWLNGHRKKRLASFSVAVTGAIVAAGVACSSGETPHQTAQVKERLDPGPISIQLSFPSGASLQHTEVAASNDVQLRDRVSVDGVVSSAAGGVAVGNDAPAAAAGIISSGLVTIGDRSSVGVAGVVTAQPSVASSQSASIAGPVLQNANLPVTTVTWSASRTGVTMGDIILQPGQSATLSAADYGQVRVQPNASIVIGAGAHFVDTFDVESQARIVVDDSAGLPVIYVASNVIFRGSVVAAVGSNPQLLIVYTGGQPVFLEAPFTGVFLAPNAELHLQAARPQGHFGTFYGRSFIAEPDTAIHSVAFDWSRFPEIYSRLRPTGNVHDMADAGSECAQFPSVPAEPPISASPVLAAATIDAFITWAGTAGERQLPELQSRIFDASTDAVVASALAAQLNATPCANVT